MIKYIENCPVCGFDLGFLPWDNGSASFEICPCCGIQFGYADAAGGDEVKRLQLYKDWREKWINDGMPWSSRGMSPPENWDPKKQSEDVPQEFR